MALSTDAIPNKPLTGSELLTYSLALIRQCAEKYYAKLTRIDFAYTMRNPAVPNYSVSIAHLQEDTITCPSCKGDDTNESCEMCCLVRRIDNTPALALNTILEKAKERMTPDWVFGRGLAYPKVKYEFTLVFKTVGGATAERKIAGEVDNPNLVRAHFKLPIIQVEKILPTEDKPMGGLDRVEVSVDASKYPLPAAPVETDLTPEVDLREVGEPEPESEDEEDDSDALMPGDQPSASPVTGEADEVPAAVPVKPRGRKKQQQ